MLCDVVLPIFTPDDMISPVLALPVLALVLVLALALAFAALLLMLLNDLNDKLKQEEEMRPKKTKHAGSNRGRKDG